MNRSDRRSRRGMPAGARPAAMLAILALAAVPAAAHGDRQNRPPTPKADVATITEDAAPTVSGNVLANDTDPDRDPLTIVRPGTYSLLYGRITIAANGAFTYTLDNTNRLVNSLRAGQSRLELIPYVVSDGRGHLAASLLTVTIRGANDAPAAVGDAGAIREDTAPNPITGNVLRNDSDAEGDRLTVSNPGTFALAHGSLVLRADGTYSYRLDNTDPQVDRLNAGDSLVDSFTYNVSDGRGGTASAVLRVTINGVTDNQAPLASADINSVREDSAPNPVSGNVLDNDSDPDADPLAVTNVGTFTLAHGSLVLRADGSYSYTLDNTDPQVNGLNAGDSLVDSFTYNVSDGRGGTASAKLSVTINGVTDNQAPLAAADINSVREDSAPNPVSGNVLDNDSDADSDALAVTNPGTFTLAHGSLVVRADGSYSYTLDNTNLDVDALNAGQSLKDEFTYNVSDGRGGTASAKLSVTINGVTDNQAPVAVADINSVREDSAPNPVSGNVLDNDSDADSDALAVTNPGTFTLAHGSLVLRADGSYSYTLDNTNLDVDALNAGQSLKDEFTYNVSDGRGGTASAKLSVTINGVTDNQAPVASADVNSVREDSVPNPVSGNVLDNDSDPDADALTVTNVGTFTLAHGSLVLRADGSYSYTLDNLNSEVNGLGGGQSLKDEFTYNVSDGRGGTASAKLSITIIGVTDS